MRLAIGLAALIALSGPALAAQVNVDALLLSGRGQPVKSEDKPPQEITLGFLIAKALWTVQLKDDTGETKYKRGVLAERVSHGGVIDLSAEEIALIKKIVGEAYSPLVIRQVYDLVDPQPAAKP